MVNIHPVFSLGFFVYLLYLFPWHWSKKSFIVDLILAFCNLQIFLLYDLILCYYNHTVEHCFIFLAELFLLSLCSGPTFVLFFSLPSTFSFLRENAEVSLATMSGMPGILVSISSPSELACNVRTARSLTSTDLTTVEQNKVLSARWLPDLTQKPVV